MNRIEDKIIDSAREKMFDKIFSKVYPLLQSINHNTTICLNKPFEQGNRKVGENICDYGLVAHMFGVHEFPIRTV
jgi:hypothetical protein